eukprot:TRINITY_DN1381_c0_g1_i1.p1 TRINITY_DN1381_c0_g1~~TRINITY_DN1381_c0_g1_i1.p1  ORF type:complete len:688 (+),score=169.66 TRINITY_DN1381_c0_g1_i1:284-2065(+)
MQPQQLPRATCATRRQHGAARVASASALQRDRGLLHAQEKRAELATKEQNERAHFLSMWRSSLRGTVTAFAQRSAVRAAYAAACCCGVLVYLDVPGAVQAEAWRRKAAQRAARGVARFGSRGQLPRGAAALPAPRQDTNSSQEASSAGGTGSECGATLPLEGVALSARRASDSAELSVRRPSCTHGEAPCGSPRSPARRLKLDTPHGSPASRSDSDHGRVEPPAAPPPQPAVTVAAPGSPTGSDAAPPRQPTVGSQPTAGSLTTTPRTQGRVFDGELTGRRGRAVTRSPNTVQRRSRAHSASQLVPPRQAWSTPAAQQQQQPVPTPGRRRCSSAHKSQGLARVSNFEQSRGALAAMLLSRVRQCAAPADGAAWGDAQAVPAADLFEELPPGDAERELVQEAFFEDGLHSDEVLPRVQSVVRISCGPDRARDFVDAAEESASTLPCKATFHGLTSTPTAELVRAMAERGLDARRCKSALFGKGAYVAAGGAKALMYAELARWDRKRTLECGGAPAFRHPLPLRVLVMLLAPGHLRVGEKGVEHSCVTTDSLKAPTQYCVPERHSHRLLPTHVITIEPPQLQRAAAADQSRRNGA